MDHGRVPKTSLQPNPPENFTFSSIFAFLGYKAQYYGDLSVDLSENEPTCHARSSKVQPVFRSECANAQFGLAVCTCTHFPVYGPVVQWSNTPRHLAYLKLTYLQK